RYVRRSPPLLWDVIRKRADLILVGFPGHADVGIARLGSLRHGAPPVVLDAFVSLYETEQDRRENADLDSLRARRFAWEDRLACRMATRVVVDTDAHVRYFVEQCG